MKMLPKKSNPLFVLAPMDDVTDTVFRQVIADCAPPDIFFTEFVNVDGLQSVGREKLIHKLTITKKEKPIVAQIWGKNPDNYYKTTKELIKMGFNGVDINMGCPVRTVVKDGCCVALVDNRELAGQIIKAVQKAAKGKIPVSVKTRVGNRTVDTSWIEFLLSHNLDALIIHGRTAKQMSKVPADWGLIGKARELRDRISPATKIIGNGDVLSRTQGEKLAKKYNLDGIMIGRGVFHDPFVFSSLDIWKSYTKKQKLGLFKKHVQLFADTYKNNERRSVILNKFCKIYIQGFDGAKEMRVKLMAAKDTDELIRLIDQQ